MVVRWHLARATSSNSNSNILYLNQAIGFKAQSLWGRVQIKLMKSKLLKCRFFRRGENRSTRGKTSQSREENQQTQPTTPPLQVHPRMDSRDTLSNTILLTDRSPQGGFPVTIYNSTGNQIDIAQIAIYNKLLFSTNQIKC